jgi:glyoxylase-like metal-dependent hydrolase (beta-lactamase superfamily II)
MSRCRWCVIATCGLALVLSREASAEVVPGSLEIQWNEGAVDCSSADSPAIEVHAYESRTFILRESLCATFEAPFLYLLIGSERALLIDTGAVADPEEVPLRATVRRLVDSAATGLPLLVVHTHGHRDHRDGDAQFAPAALVSADLKAVQRYFDFRDWPEGEARIELGERTVTVLPAPGHHAAHLVFHDTRTGLLFTGDHLLPGRLFIDDWEDYRDTTLRLVEFASRVEVSLVLGAHNELDQSGRTYWPGSTHHPDERHSSLSSAHLQDLSEALEHFNGFYAQHGDFVLMNVRNLGLVALSGSVLIVAVLAWSARRARRYWRGSGGATRREIR